MTPKSPARSRSRREPGALARLRDEWPIRAGLALSALVLAYFGMSTTMANVLVKVDPVTAHRLAPRDGRIMAAATERKFGARPDFAADSEVADLARNALRRDAMAVEALNVLGLQAQARADQEQADRLFNHSHALSRRELEPQLAKIQNAVSRGDIVEALKYYDIALRTSNKAQGMLFPVLGSAIAEPKVRSALIALLSRGTPWTEPFVESVPKSPLPKAAAQFFLEGEAAGLRVTNSEKERVVAALVAAEHFEDAWDFYRTFHRNAARDRSRDPGFRLMSGTPSPLDWRVISAPGLSAAILRDDDSGYLEFSLPPGTGTPVVRQMQLLPPGRYRLDGRSSHIDQPSRSRPYWLLACLSGAELGRIDVPSSSESGGAFSGHFSVPSNCRVQVLSLVARASDEIYGVSGRIHRAGLVPAGSPD